MCTSTVRSSTYTLPPQTWSSSCARVYTRSQLLDQVWGDHVYIEERTVDVHIRRLRHALEPFGQDGAIETVRGTGYRLSAAGAR